MPKKTMDDRRWMADDGQQTMDDGQLPETAAEGKVKQDEKPAQTVYYEPVMWKNVKLVFRCATCGTYRDIVEDMIFHVVSHLPAKEQIEVFDQLTKEK